MGKNNTFKTSNNSNVSYSDKLSNKQICETPKVETSANISIEKVQPPAKFIKEDWTVIDKIQIDDKCKYQDLNTFLRKDCPKAPIYNDMYFNCGMEWHYAKLLKCKAQPNILYLNVLHCKVLIFRMVVDIKNDKIALYKGKDNLKLTKIPAFLENKLIKEIKNIHSDSIN